MLMEAANVESTIYKDDVDGGNKDYYSRASSARIRKRKARLPRLNGWMRSKTHGWRAQRCKPSCSKHFKLVGRLGSRYNKRRMLGEAAELVLGLGAAGYSDQAGT